ncbi:hypothetical protein HFP51_09725 [Parasphingopyxis sp. CP4]|uniref:hypothetical protein n=1 Tax=Parasphingopyxis sp. CP4 TaxID=2724527 RepID=UPI0015A08BC4|nr:hypothetical protein [Parasphingopyxis sp. CP4]QLC22433.1 hypothetical protein HFP51_09725 [Parasphingopyxis sp. CP4]
MRKSVLVAAAATVAFAGPVAAQTEGGSSVTGAVNVTGSVTGICAVIPDGGSPTDSFTGTISLGELNDSDGTLKDTLIGSSSASPAGTFTTRVVCTDNNPQVTISATPLEEAPDQITPAAGYADMIDYTARVAINTASGGVVPFDTRTSDAVGGGGPLNDLIAAGPQDNVSVSVFDLDTVGGNTNILVVGQYLGVISITISPNT